MHEAITKSIAGRDVTLYSGVRYHASRPFVSRGRTVYPVTIQAGIGSPPYVPTVVIRGLTYDEANQFLNAFNNGETSFDGRVW